MHRSRFRFPWLSALLLLLAASTACSRGSGGTRSPDDGQGVWVLGSGQASGAPDVARAHLGVRVRAATVEQATQEANRRMQDVLRALTSAGIAEGDLQTRSLSVHEERDWEPPPVPPQPPPRPLGGKDGGPEAMAESSPPPPTEARTSYVAENMLQVTVRDLGRIGEILGVALTAGANQVHGVNMELEDASVLVRQAQEKAVKDAQAQAEQLARLAGKRLGRVVAVRVMGGSGHPGPMPMAYGEAMDARFAKNVPVQTGELTVFEQVQMHFEFEDSGP